MIKGITKVEMFSEKIEGSERKSLSGRDEADYLVGEVSYTKGGINYFSGNVSKRGYRISVQMQTKGDGFTSFMIGGGICQSQWVEEAKMLSGKRLAALVMDETIRARLQTIKAECLAIYRAKHPVDEEQVGDILGPFESDASEDSVDRGEMAGLMAGGLIV